MRNNCSGECAAAAPVNPIGVVVAIATTVVLHPTCMLNLVRAEKDILKMTMSAKVNESKQE